MSHSGQWSAYQLIGPSGPDAWDSSFNLDSPWPTDGGDVGASFAELPKPDMNASRKRIKVAIVAPSMAILGGQAVQADRLIRAWSDDPDIEAWLVAVNPVPRGAMRRALHIKYIRTLLTQLIYWPSLVRQVARADVV